ncbi:hypothetical protein M2145_002869 [Lachnospiraceae bacterium PF1-21]|uniref:Nitrous oxide-stimulated promoter family protein n=1 Tax=Ohessyouella blattaphilus TaxID=2949333 RepID=A0ABT1ELH2_9FIRM|nr:nitrous oxide-stimulated promoter family protein [Ohessyouella blattaphilus]MCP1110652.1 nitrous oxide-stimulated promoter family protein [Ohessyouella blattaphilus]MCR8564046.1 nitrous oxide-stimulated promoter family protein [Ohessyouella blattaphilus]
MSKNIEKKIAFEKQLLGEMIALYCRKKHKHLEGLCESCQGLQAYAYERTERCPFMETKTFCSNCKVHCYQVEKREEIRKVMRFSGPRMLLVHPLLVFRHVYESKKENRRR